MEASYVGEGSTVHPNQFTRCGPPSSEDQLVVGFQYI